MIVATAALISPKPSGLNIQQIAPPMIPSMLLSSSISGSKASEPLTTPNTDPAQMMIEDSRMMVPAFLMNDQPRSHIERSTFPTVGQ